MMFIFGAANPHNSLQAIKLASAMDWRTTIWLATFLFFFFFQLNCSSTRFRPAHPHPKCNTLQQAPRESLRDLSDHKFTYESLQFYWSTQSLFFLTVETKEGVGCVNILAIVQGNYNFNLNEAVGLPRFIVSNLIHLLGTTLYTQQIAK